VKRDHRINHHQHPWTNKSFGGKGVEGEVPGSGDEPSARGWISGGDGRGGAAMLDACYYGAEQRRETVDMEDPARSFNSKNLPK